MEYMEHERAKKGEGQEWTMNNKHPKANIVIDAPDDHENVIACINETKASHNIPWSYHHAMSTASAKLLLHCLLLKQSTLPCLNVPNKCLGCIIGWTKSKSNTIFQG